MVSVEIVQSAENCRALLAFFSNAIVETFRVRINAIQLASNLVSSLFSLKLTFDRSKLESLCDVSVTRIGDTISFGFWQTVYGDSIESDTFHEELMVK